MGGQLFSLLLLLPFSNCLDCFNLIAGTSQTCTGDTVCKVTIVGRTIVVTEPCAAPLKAECETSLALSSAPTSFPTLAVNCQCKTTGCDKTIDTFKKKLDEIAAQSKPSLSDKCKTVGDVSVLVYSILFALVLAFVPAIIFFLVRLFMSKRKMDALEAKVTTSLRQLQQDMVGNSKNVHEVRKKMEQLTSEVINSGSREQTVTGAETRTGGGTVEKKGSESEHKKGEKKEDEPEVKSVTLGPPK